MLAFLLEFFIAVGSGYAVLGHWGLFAGQLVLNLSMSFAMCPCCCMVCAGSGSGREGCMLVFLIIAVVILILTSLATFVWWIITLVQIGGGFINAADGSPISEWVSSVWLI